MAGKEEVDDVTITWNDETAIHEYMVELGEDNPPKPYYITESREVEEGEQIVLIYHVGGKKSSELTARVYRKKEYSDLRILHKAEPEESGERTHTVFVKIPNAKVEHTGEWYLVAYYTQNKAPVLSRRNVKVTPTKKNQGASSRCY